MRVSVNWSLVQENADTSGLNDLRRNSILEIGIVMLVFAWLIFLSSIGFGGRLQGLFTALLLLGGAVGIFVLRRKHLPWAS